MKTIIILIIQLKVHIIITGVKGGGEAPRLATPMGAHRYYG